MKRTSYRGAAGSYYERPITSERAELVLAALRDEGATVESLLAAGQVTLRAVARALYGGDMERAKRAIYGK